jgi:hypothetical protein
VKRVANFHRAAIELYASRSALLASNGERYLLSQRTHVVQKKPTLTPATLAAIIKPTNAISDRPWRASDGLLAAKLNAP